MLFSSKIVVEVHVGALGDLVYESHLEQFVNNLEYEVFRVEVLELRADPLVNAVEAKTALRRLQLARDKVAQFVTLVTDLIQVQICLRLQAVKEALLFELVDALLKQLSRCLVPFLAKAKFGLDLGQ